MTRREVDGTYILEMHKPEKRGELKSDFVMDFCTEVVKVSSQNKIIHLPSNTNVCRILSGVVTHLSLNLLEMPPQAVDRRWCVLPQRVILK